MECFTILDLLRSAAVICVWESNNYVGVFCRERDFHTLARIVALTTTIAQLRLKLKIQVTLLYIVRAFFYSLYDAINVARI